MSMYDDLSTKERDIVDQLCKLTGIDTTKAQYLLSSSDWNIRKALEKYKLEMKKKPKEKKVFKKGDVVTCIDNSPGKLPPDCAEFLITYKKFKVIDVNDKLNIDLGYKLEETGNPYYFSPNRFELLNGTAPVKIMNSVENEDNIKESPEKELPAKSIYYSPVNKYGYYQEKRDIEKDHSDW